VNPTTSQAADCNAGEGGQKSVPIQTAHAVQAAQDGALQHSSEGAQPTRLRLRRRNRRRELAAVGQAVRLVFRWRSSYLLKREFRPTGRHFSPDSSTTLRPLRRPGGSLRLDHGGPPIRRVLFHLGALHG
jgi:hypothetical protein